MPARPIAVGHALAGESVTFSALPVTRRRVTNARRVTRTATEPRRAPSPVQRSTRRLRVRDLLVDHFLELVERLRARERPAVDEEGGRPVHAGRDAVRDVLVDLRAVRLLRVALAELRVVHSELLGPGL